MKTGETIKEYLEWYFLVFALILSIGAAFLIWDIVWSKSSWFTYRGQTEKVIRDIVKPECLKQPTD